VASPKLQIEFSSAESFQREYQRNIANGGIFVPTEDALSLHDVVSVELVLAFCGERVVLDAEVVHVLPVELAGAGAEPGVALQFASSAGELRKRFESLVGPEPPQDEKQLGTGQRAAPRSTARVSARLRTEQGAIATRTRDLSRTGVLVAVEGEVLPVGSPVSVSMANPRTGEELEVEGRIVRHVEGARGAVVAMGIEFRVPTSQQARVNRFVDEVKASEHTRRLGGIHGPIGEIGIESLLQMFGTCAPQGTFSVQRGDQEGVIAFSSGQLCMAETGGLEGDRALAEMLSWRDGFFEFEARLAPEMEGQEGRLLEAAILDAMRHLDEHRSVDLGSLPAGAKLRVDSAAVALAGDLGQLAEAILELARVGFSISKVIDVIPEPDAEIYACLGDLVEGQLVEILDPQSD